MILTVHMLLGAAIASYIKNPVLAIILAFISHYFLDFIPHQDYPAQNLLKKDWANSFNDFLKIIADAGSGIILVYFLSDRSGLVFWGSFFAAMPDFFSAINILAPNKILSLHQKFHNLAHFLSHKKIPVKWRILSQVIVAVVSTAMLVA